MSDKELEDLVLTHAQQLGEQFDSVLVLVSWQDGTKTRCLKKRSGNWHAALGMAHEFISESQAEVMVQHGIAVPERHRKQLQSVERGAMGAT